MRGGSAKVERFRRLLYGTIVASTSLACTAWYAVSRGQDFNWDQRNYHIGVPFLLSQGTFWDSVAPAGVQSYFNPLMLQIQFWGIQHLTPISLAFALATIQSLAFIIAGLICARVVAPAESWKALALALLGFVLCLMAPVSLSESGTTFIDLVTSVPILAAYALLLTRGDRIGLVTCAALSGALLGLATSLKLTNAVFAIGGLGFALAGPDTVRQRLRWISVYCAAGLLAFVAVGGVWHLRLWQRFGNPFFPYFNNIFHSPDYSFAGLREERFLPKSFFDIWLYPLHWLNGDSPSAYNGSPSSEVNFVDPRWIAAVIGVTLVLAALTMFRQWRQQRLIDPKTGLFFVFGISYLIWLTQFGVHRYLVSLDILCGAIVLALVMLLFRSFLLQFALLSCWAVFTWYRMLVPDWGHLPWLPHWQGISRESYALERNSIIFLADNPDSFVAASFSPDTRYVELSDTFDLRLEANTSLTRQLKRMLSESEGNLNIIDRGILPELAVEMLNSYGLHVGDRCETLRIVETFRLCNVVRGQR